MITGWVAGDVRARAMTHRRLGRAGTRALASRGSLEEALVELAAGPYGHDVRPGQTLAQAQHAVGAALLWNLRVLTGWLPREGVAGMRAFASWFELLNVEAHLEELAGGSGTGPPYHLGTLGTAWPRLSGARSADEVRQVLATSPWGDPGGDSRRDTHLALRGACAGRVASTHPEARPWAAAALTLLLARELLLTGRPVTDELARSVDGLLGPRARTATTLAALRAAVAPEVRRVLDPVDEAADLWRGELAWWELVEQDAFGLLHAARRGPAVVRGAVALLAVDAWRVCGALELAARGGSPEVVDAQP